jgi:hypothetical protein
LFVNLQQIIEIWITIKKLTIKEILAKGVLAEPVWEKEVSGFFWECQMD